MSAGEDRLESALETGMVAMRVVCWNMARNTTSKRLAVHERAWHFLAALDPDIALVQEATPPVWAGDIWDTVMAPLPSWGWCSVVLAKPWLQVAPFIAQPDTTWDRQGLIATATVTTRGSTTLLCGSVHAPLMRPVPAEYLAPFSSEEIKLPSYPAAMYYDVPYAIYRQRAYDRFLIGGDWNVSPVLWDLHHANSHEGEFFARAVADGWVDCYRRFHDSEGRTWFRGTNRPYQMDHAFCDSTTALSLDACQIDTYPAETAGLSDHAPLIIELSQ